MTWVAWKQHRAAVITALGLIGAVIAIMILMRFRIASMLAEFGEAGCLAKSDGCPDQVTIQVLENYGGYLSIAPVALFVLPVMLGIFVGAPLFAKELSQGSHMFSLTQGTSRKRWWAVKLAVTLGPIVVAVGILGLVSHWALGTVINPFFGPLAFGTFEVQGPVMMGYLVVSFSLAATLGLLTRNNVVPMVITIGVYIAIVATVVLLARPSYLPAEIVETRDAKALEQFELGTPSESLAVGELYVDDKGNEYGSYAEICGPDKCVEDDIVSYAIHYQPPSRFWPFQGIETGVYLVLGAAALTVGARRLRALP